MQPGLILSGIAAEGHMSENKRIRAVIIRGGTSKGVYLLAGDLPENPAVRDRVILAIFGSPDPRQIDGLGGADPLTSKVAILRKSSRQDADVDYTFGYVGIDRAVIDYDGNCGNILQGVGPFAIDEGLVPVEAPTTRVRIFNTNTQKIIEAEVPVHGGKAASDGDFVLNGVPGTGARIVINFINSMGSKTGKLLPTGNVSDPIQLADGRTVMASLVDAANPAVFVRAGDLGLTGREMPADAAANPSILAVMEEIRVKAAIMMKLAASPAQVGPAVPKVAFVAPAQDYRTISGTLIKAADCDLLARTKAMAVMHKAYAVTGGICIGAAARIPGTVVHEVVNQEGPETDLVKVGHPSGVSSYVISVQRNEAGEFELKKSAVAGTARRIMDGYVYVPSQAFHQD
jgi:methylitaconate Delta-isomerase